MNIVITGGGTGGHLYPGLELAKHLQKQGHSIYYIASSNGVDKKIIQKQEGLEHIKIDYWDLKGIKRSIRPSAIYVNIKTGFKLINLLLKSKSFLRSNKIDVVIGVGGYISYPLVSTAARMKVYTIIHEQNSYPGLVNRKLSQKVDKVTVAYKEARKYFNQKVYEVSNPRVDMTQNYLNKKYNEKLNLNKGKEIVLFLGGSLGAQKINDLFFEFINNDKDNKYQCILISGMLNNEIANKELGDNIILENTNDILEYMATADYIISRAGATTLLEIIYLEKKSIIIPSPNVVANHQYYNAYEFSEERLIYMLLEEKCDFSSFLLKFNELKNDNEIKLNLQKYDKILSLGLFDEIIKESYDTRANK